MYKSLSSKYSCIFSQRNFVLTCLCSFTRLIHFPFIFVFSYFSRCNNLIFVSCKPFLRISLFLVNLWCFSFFWLMSINFLSCGYLLFLRGDLRLPVITHTTIRGRNMSEKHAKLIIWETTICWPCSFMTRIVTNYCWIIWLKSRDISHK